MLTLQQSCSVPHLKDIAAVCTRFSCIDRIKNWDKKTKCVDLVQYLYIRQGQILNLCDVGKIFSIYAKGCFAEMNANL